MYTKQGVSDAANDPHILGTVGNDTSGHGLPSRIIVDNWDGSLKLYYYAYDINSQTSNINLNVIAFGPC